MSLTSCPGNRHHLNPDRRSFRFDPAFDARKMIGEPPDRRRTLHGDCRRRRAGTGTLGLALQFFERQFELFDLEGKLLGGLTEGHPPELGKLETQRLDQCVASRQSGFQLGDPGILVDGARGWFRHENSIADRASKHQVNRQNPRLLSRQ